MNRLAKAPAANVGDVMQRLYAMESGVRPFNQHGLCGPAVTVRVPAGDNLFVHAVMDMLSPGDVLVVSGGAGAERALLGELMLQYLETKQVGGVVVDGLVRDLDFIRGRCSFGVYARGTSPNGPYKNGPGEINFPVVCGGVCVNPGDVMLGDADGLVVVPQGDLDEVLVEVEELQRKEASITKQIVENQSFDRPWVAAQIDLIGAVTVNS
jgi:RraA family protein